MSVRRDADFLLDIQEAVRRISEYIADMSYEQFRKDIRTQDAVLRNLEIIGEAAKSISAAHFASSIPKSPGGKWRLCGIASFTIISA